MDLPSTSSLANVNKAPQGLELLAYHLLLLDKRRDLTGWETVSGPPDGSDEDYATCPGY